METRLISLLQQASARKTPTSPSPQAPYRLTLFMDKVLPSHWKGPPGALASLPPSLVCFHPFQALDLQAPSP